MEIRCCPVKVERTLCTHMYKHREMSMGQLELSRKALLNVADSNV